VQGSSGRKVLREGPVHPMMRAARRQGSAPVCFARSPWPISQNRTRLQPPKTKPRWLRVRRTRGRRRPGFKVDLYVSGLDKPRLIRTALNGDVFQAESEAGRLKLFRGIGKEGKPRPPVRLFSRRNEPERSSGAQILQLQQR
jgi:hypothetical protein